MVWFPLACTFDAYDVRTAARLSTATGTVVKAAVPATLIYLLIPFLTPPEPTSRQTLAGFPFLLISLLVAGEACTSWAWRSHSSITAHSSSALVGPGAL